MKRDEGVAGEKEQRRRRHTRGEAWAAIASELALAVLPHCSISQEAGSPDRKGPEGLRRRDRPLSAQTSLRGSRKLEQGRPRWLRL